MWPNARISVMGGEQAASVLATVKRDGIEAAGETWSAEDEEAFKDPIRATYEAQGSPYHATARLWDDGIIDPTETREVLGARAGRRPARPDRAAGLGHLPHVMHPTSVTLEPTNWPFTGDATSRKPSWSRPR
jgi:3-methylcrotonyl-CoA carboxylase beta subunit